MALFFSDSNEQTSEHVAKQNVSLISSLKEFKELKEEWQILNDESLKGTIFSSWDWLFTWWETYQNDCTRVLYILTCRDSKNNLIGIAPFQIINNPKKYFPCSRQIIMLGAGETDGSLVLGEYMDLLIKQENEESVIKHFSDYLFDNKSQWNGVKFQQILDDSLISKLFFDYKKQIIYSKQAEGFRTIITLPETYKAYLMSLRKKMRNNITRTFSRLESEQSYTIELIDNINEVEDGIALLAELNRSRRGDLELPSSFEQANFEKYHRKLAKQLLSSNHPLQNISLRVLRFSGVPVAMLYSFFDGETIHAYQSGFEKENGHRYSLLTTMLTQEISNSIDNKKIKCFNFMFSDDELTYKRRYAGSTETMYRISFDQNNIRGKFYMFLHGVVKAHVRNAIDKFKKK